MENLPSELLAKIFNLLPDIDILNLPSHIISFTLTDAQAQALLQTMEVWLEKNSLERLVRISRHPNLARHVQELIIYNECLNDITSTEYLASYWLLHHPKKHSFPPKNLSFETYRRLASNQTPGERSVAASFGEYRMQLNEQIRMEEQQDDVRLLSIAFGHLINLKNISIDNKGTLRLRNALGDAWCPGVEYHYLQHCGSHLTEVLLRAMSTSARKVTSFEIMHETGPLWYTSGMTTINFPDIFTNLPPNTISSALQSLRCLNLRSVYYETDEIKYHDGDREESCGYYWSHKGDEDEDYGTTKAIAQMLNSAPLLEELTLNFYADYDKRRFLPVIPYIPLHSMRGSNDLQHLKKVCLGNFKTRQDQLVRFLLKIAGTVTYIHVDGVVLDYGSWLAAFSRLRGKLTHLETFKVGFQGLYDAGLGEEKMDPEELEISVNLCDISFRIVPCEDDHLLGWLGDGTGSNPASPPAPR